MYICFYFIKYIFPFIINMNKSFVGGKSLSSELVNNRWWLSSGHQCLHKHRSTHYDLLSSLAHLPRKTTLNSIMTRSYDPLCSKVIMVLIYDVVPLEGLVPLFRWKRPILPLYEGPRWRSWRRWREAAMLARNYWVTEQKGAQETAIITGRGPMDVGQGAASTPTTLHASQQKGSSFSPTTVFTFGYGQSTQLVQLKSKKTRKEME